MNYADAMKGNWVVAKDIAIPAGTEVSCAPSQVRRFTPFASAIIGPTKDTTYEWSMPLDEALELGLIKKADK